MSAEYYGEPSDFQLEELSGAVETFDQQQTVFFNAIANWYAAPRSAECLKQADAAVDSMGLAFVDVVDVIIEDESLDTQAKAAQLATVIIGADDERTHNLQLILPNASFEAVDYVTAYREVNDDIWDDLEYGTDPEKVRDSIVGCFADDLRTDTEIVSAHINGLRDQGKRNKLTRKGQLTVFGLMVGGLALGGTFLRHQIKSA